MPDESKPPAKLTRAQQIFKEAPEDLQKLIRDVLEKERRVMHKRNKTNIHQDIYQAVKTFIK